MPCSTGTARRTPLRYARSRRYRLLDYEAAKKDWNGTRKENFQVQQDAIDPNCKGKHLQLRFTTVEDEGVFKDAVVRDHDYRPQLTEWEESVCAENPNKYGTEKDVAVPTADRPDFTKTRGQAMANFFAELKRRHIYRVIASSAVVAWALLSTAALAQWSIGQPGTREAPKGQNRYAYLVMADPLPGREFDFNDGYQNMHMGDLVQLPGWTGAQRFAWCP